MQRRKFISTVGLALGAVPLAAHAPFNHPIHQAAPVTIDDVLKLIYAEIPGTPFSPTVDTLKTGKPDQKVKGIVTTMFATVDVIRKTAEIGANFIIAHEPTFYNHLDATDWLDNDAVYQFKQELLSETGIAVWRFHDYWHRHDPDGILMGVLAALGWQQYYDKGHPRVVEIPALSLADLVAHAKKRLGIHRVSVIGDASQKCSKIALSPGAAGGRSQIQLIRDARPDVLLVGEVNEWETAEYVRDARAKGDKTALVVLGHSVSEEPGMNWLGPWLQSRVAPIKVTPIASNSPYAESLY